MVLVLSNKALHRMSFEDWSQQSAQQRRRWLPRHLLDNLLVVHTFAALETQQPSRPAAAEEAPEGEAAPEGAAAQQ